VKVNQAYRFALGPAPAQERALRSHAGAARFAWNWALAKCRERYGAEGRWYSAIGLHKLWNAEKKADPALAWWGGNSKCAYQEAFRDLDRALRDFTRSRKGERKGRRLGFPRFKKRGKCRDSFRFGAGVIRCAGRTVTLPRVGTLRTHESTRKLARKLGNGAARILSATVTRTAQRWYVSFAVEVDRVIPARHPRPGSAVGVDLGIKTLLTGVDDQGRTVTVDGPKALRSSLRHLRRASRAHSRKANGSANRRKSAARLARIHARVASVRADALHKATTGLAARYETVVAEDLNVAGMTRNRRLARAISDQGFGAARQMLGYKTTWNRGQLITAGRFYPSSRTCSGCGAVKAKLPLSGRTYLCEACGLIMDRDENAARNLLKLAASGAESQNACGPQVRPGAAGRSGMKQEPGTALAGQTGTASGQPLAAGRELTHAH
jgi:putative transposase